MEDRRIPLHKNTQKYQNKTKNNDHIFTITYYGIQSGKQSSEKTASTNIGQGSCTLSGCPSPSTRYLRYHNMQMYRLTSLYVTCVFGSRSQKLLTHPSLFFVADNKEV